MVLDLMLPGEDGLAICRRLRAAANDIAIIMLTAKGDDVDRIVGLEMGADDYLAKPFNPRELVARIHAVLRRQAPGADAGRAQRASEDRRVRPVRAGPRQPRPHPRRQADPGLTTGEFALLKALAPHPREPLSRDKLMELARGREHESYDRSIDVQVSRLRKLLGEDPQEPRYIQTVWGFGLRVHPRRGLPRNEAAARARCCGARSWSSSSRCSFRRPPPCGCCSAT